MSLSKKHGTSAESDEASDVSETSLLGPEERMVRLMPLHAIAGINKGITRQVGRPRKVDKRPTESDLEYHEAMVQEKSEFVERDPVVQAIQNRSDSGDLLQRIKEEVAREAAALHFQRIENEKFGKDTAQVSTRRIDALQKISQIELEIKKMGADVLNLKSERIQKLFRFIIESVREGCTSTNMDAKQIDLLFNHLGTSFDGWEERAAEMFK